MTVREMRPAWWRTVFGLNAILFVLLAAFHFLTFRDATMAMLFFVTGLLNGVVYLQFRR